MNHIPNTKIRQVFLLLLICILFIILFWNLRFFLPAILGAYSLYVLLSGPMQHMVSEWGWRKRIAAGMLMLLSFIIIMLPVNGLIQILQGRVMSTLQGSQDVLHSLERLIQDFELRYNLKILSGDSLKSIAEWGLGQVRSVVDATLGGMLIVIVMYFILWFMLSDGERLEGMIFDRLPLRPENVNYVKRELKSLVYSNAIGIPLMGLVQGFVGGIAYWILGIPDIWLWILLTCIMGMMPLFGVSMAYIPLSLMLFSQGNTGQAIFILIYGFIVIGSVDNIARMWLLKKIGNAHPLITLFGVIVGLKLFGFVGFVFGPIMISMFWLLLKIYNKEFGGDRMKLSSE
ncbi:MAG TPA: AI-2E family transporter [Saprospiraceae bacterium]|nr:AI-2E family transporter [Saprospiraceae bacterium]